MQRAEDRSLLPEGACYARRPDEVFFIRKSFGKFLGEIGHDAAVFERLRLPPRAVFELGARL